MKHNVEFVVSGCLAGLRCRYDGASRPCPKVVELVNKGRAKPVCPESLSGLPCPRPPCEQSHGRVVCKNGDDVTQAFEKGASRALKIAIESGATAAILKSRSPSCGFGQIYDGTFSKTLTPGEGIFAAKLAEAGFKIYSEDNLPDA